MSLDTQVALARPPRGESTHLSRAARQVVPPFLQKLYEIVNDPANEELIKWSDNGDSFYVLNHEKFAREVLGRWFKHQKFASFVRQLNMYGFHKIPHLQQGVLKSDSDTEPWHFEHPNFHRGQPDLLCLIQRKKQPPHGQPDDPILDVHDHPHTTAPVQNVSQGHLMDINSIVNGVAAIKHHQQTISADLSSLKQSNDALWKETVAARQRHAKHQDTINRILKFLAGVFGHADESPHSPDGSRTPPQVITPRVRQRLMIANGTPSPKKHVEPIEVDDNDADIVRMRNGSTLPSERFASIETPATSIGSPSVDPVAPTEPMPMTPMTEPEHDPSNSPPTLPQPLSRTASSASTAGFTSASSNSPAPSTSTLQSPTSVQNNVDAVWQAAIQHMMNSPASLQRIIQALANQQPIPHLSSTSETISPSATNNSAIATYDPNQSDFSRWISQSPPPPNSAAVSQPLFSSLNVDYADDSPPLQLLLDESSRLQKSYRDATEIDADMDMLQSSINTLIQNLGIDPNTLSASDEDPAQLSLPSPLPSTLSHSVPSTSGFSTPLPPEPFTSSLSLDNPTDVSHPDHLLDSLLSQIGDGSRVGVGSVGHGLDGLDYSDITDHYDHNAQIDGTSIEDASTEQLTAFLDEASAAASAADTPTPSSSSSSTAGKSPQVQPNGLGANHQKRKSDVVDSPLGATLEEGTGKKVKRKR